MLHGTVQSTTETAVILLVNDIGYLVFTPHAGQYQTEQALTFYTHLAVRETALDLYGFTNPSELTVFEELLSVPKIGPKSAVQIMTHADVTTLRTAVSMNDPSHLTKISGIGKKTAEKIVQELSNETSYLAQANVGTETTTDTSNPALADAVDALVTLGYPLRDAQQTVRSLPENVTTTNEAVREALKILGQN